MIAKWIKFGLCWGETESLIDTMPEKPELSGRPRPVSAIRLSIAGYSWLSPAIAGYSQIWADTKLRDTYTQPQTLSASR